MRREWLLAPSMEKLDFTERTVSVSSFVNVDMRRFGSGRNCAAIPAFDGLKPVQRKILFAMRATKEVPVLATVLAGSMIQSTAYHHGDASAKGAIIGMAQAWTGSNNIACLEAFGAGGSRRGKKMGVGKVCFTDRRFGVLTPQGRNRGAFQAWWRCGRSALCSCGP